MYSWLGPFCPHVDRQWRLVYVENVDVAWYVSEYCKQVEGAGIKIDTCCMVVLPTLSLSWETSPFKVELLRIHEIDGELLQVTFTFTLVLVLFTYAS